MTLQIVLRDGFRNDTVTIMVDGKEVYRKSGVTTDLSISAADSVEVRSNGPVVRLEVVVARGPSRTEEIRVGETPFVDVRVSQGKLEFAKSQQQIPMM